MLGPTDQENPNYISILIIAASQRQLHATLRNPSLVNRLAEPVLVEGVGLAS